MRKLSPCPSLPGTARRENGSVLILLPPSETKTRPAPGSAPALPVDAPGPLPGLEDARAIVARAAVRTARGRDAADRLGVPASSPELVDRMAALAAEPHGPALSVYAGVLYDQLGDAHPSDDRRVLVQSALYGLLDAGSEHIPAYRVSAGSRLHRLGTAGAWWRPRLRAVADRLLAEAADSPSPLVLDCRSGSYRAMMPLRSTPAVRVLEVAPVQERGGRRTVVSHDAKRYRGWAARVLLEDPRPLPDAGALRDLLAAAADGALDIELDGDRLVVVDRVG